jgi:hypothetical protein
MKGIAGILFGAFVLALVGSACLVLGLLDRDMVRAQQDINTQNYAGAEATYDKAERYFQYASHIPGIGNRPVNDIRARKAALRYWQRDYGAIVPKQSDPVTAIPSDNVELQFVVANAVYRSNLARAKDRPSTLQALDAGINAELAVLKNAKRHDDAAYNLEYLVRLRDDVEKGRRRLAPLNPPLSALGSLGIPSSDLESSGTFKLYVPLDSEERNKVGNAGKAVPKGRKG